MARPLAIDSLSLTGGGSALVTDAAGMIRPDQVAGLFVEDVRVISTWRLDTDPATQLVGCERLGPSCDRLTYTVAAPGTIDPVGTLERTRTVSAGGLREDFRLSAFVAPLNCSLRLAAARDDQPVFVAGDNGDHPTPESTLVAGPAAGRFILPQPAGGAAVAITAGDWHLEGAKLIVDVELAAGASHVTSLSVAANGELGLGSASVESATTIEASSNDLVAVTATGRADLQALTLAVEGRRVLGAGSPFFLAVFGRDSLISAMQALLDNQSCLLDTLAVLAEHQATNFDDTTRAEPGRILHELRLGRAGVFGVAPRRAYYGAVDTAPLFVIALGEALNWGASRDRIAALLPAARAALDWCRVEGDADDDGFIESVPHRTGLTNLGWKDSSDSIVDSAGTVIVGSVALAEVQGYWYRALRTMAEIEQRLGLGDGAASVAAAEQLAARFAAAFVFDRGDGPFIGLALDPDKQLLDVRTSNAGHVLWSGILAANVARPVAEQLAAPDLFSGWGIRTLSSSAAGYNPFGYHRGSVWPHDTGFALHGAARYGVASTVNVVADGLVALGTALDGQLPELISGLDRAHATLPIPYAAACRPQAWAAGAPLIVVRSLLGLEPDVPAGLVRLNPMLREGETITIRRLRLGEHEISLTARGNEVVEIDAPGLDVITGPEAVLATTGWCPPAQSLAGGGNALMPS